MDGQHTADKHRDSETGIPLSRERRSSSVLEKRREFKSFIALPRGRPGAATRKKRPHGPQGPSVPFFHLGTGWNSGSWHTLPDSPPLAHPMRWDRLSRAVSWLTAEMPSLSLLNRGKARYRLLLLCTT